jgi:hypothetical protein
MPVPNRKLFIAYRRDDSAGHAGRLYDRLSGHFGVDRIFMDIDTIKPGEDFVSILENAVASCEILIAIIGRYWLTSSDKNGRRIDRPDDFVRLEILTAINRGIPIIPVLVHGAKMPNPDELPKGLEPLTRLQALEVTDTRWAYDVSKLISILERILSTGLNVEPAIKPAKSYLKVITANLRRIAMDFRKWTQRIKLSRVDIWSGIAIVIFLIIALPLAIKIGSKRQSGVVPNSNASTELKPPFANETNTNRLAKPPMGQIHMEWAIEATRQNIGRGEISITEVKTILKNMNLFDDKIDESINESLIEAVWRFQNLHDGPSRADGALGRRTYQWLMRFREKPISQ